MGQVSKKYLPPKVQERILNLFLSSIALCSNKEKAASFLEDLLTPTEKIMLAKRVSIAFMLENGYDYGTIRNIIKVSTPTIATVSLWLKEKGEGYRQIIGKIKKREGTREAWQEIVDAIEEYFTIVPGRDWSKAKKDLWKHRQKRQKAF